MPGRWKFPKWMEPFRGFLLGVNTVEDIEDLMNDHTTVVQVNAPRALMCVSLKSQVQLLMRLHEGSSLV